MSISTGVNTRSQAKEGRGKPRPRPLSKDREADRLMSDRRVLHINNKRRDSLEKSPRPPRASSPKVSAAMRGNRGIDTGPEVLLRSSLWKSGIRGYRKHVRGVPGSPDLAFPGHQLAIFVHGCFWHHCPECNIPIPKTNTSYWQEKLRRNTDRDKRVCRELQKAGWKTLRFWECEVRCSPQRCLRQVQKALIELSRGRGSRPGAKAGANRNRERVSK